MREIFTPPPPPPPPPPVETTPVVTTVPAVAEAPALVRPAHLRNFIGPVATSQLVPAGSPQALGITSGPTLPGTGSTLPPTDTVLPGGTAPVFRFASTTPAPTFQFADTPTPPAGPAPQDAAVATSITDDAARGKSIDQIATDRGLTREEVIAQLQGGGMTVTSQDYANGDTRVTTITDPATGRTITENFDFHAGSYYIEQTGPNGEVTSGPIRDESGQTETSIVDPQTGEITTRLVDDLGDGTVTDTTHHGGVTVVTTTPQGGTPTTVVNGPEGPVTLTPAQDTSAGGVKPITDDIAAGRSIDQIAEQRGLTREQVIAQLQASGMDVSATTPTGANGDVRITTITDPRTGRTYTENFDFQHGTYYNSVTGGDGPATTTPVRDESGRKMTTSVDPDTGGISTTWVDDFGDGTVETRTRLPSGVTVESTTPKDGEANVVVTLPDGTEVGLAGDQVPTREGIQGIADDVAAGKTLDQIASDRNLSRDQVIAQLRAAGYNVNETDPARNNGIGGLSISDERTSELIAGNTDNHRNDSNTTYVVQPDGTTRTVTTDLDGTTTESVVLPSGRVERTETDPQGRKTHETTANGYTLTTAPDGTLTLHNNNLDVDIPIKPGSREEALAKVLLDAEPNSADPAKAREGEVVTTFIDGFFSGESLETLLNRAEAAGAERDRLEGLGGLGAPINVPVGEDQVPDPLSAVPPISNAPSGKKWMPMLVDGQWRWVDPDLAVAIRNEQIALAQLAEGQATAQENQAQLDVYALDPAYDGAVADARDTINEALEPHELEWNLKRPDGTLEDARSRLATAGSLLNEASGAVDDYQRSLTTLQEAIETNQNMPVYPDRVNPVFTDPDSDFDADAYVEEQERLIAKGKQAAADLAELFSEQELAAAQGDQNSIDYLAGAGEFRLSQLDRNSNEYKQLEPSVEQLRQARDAAGGQVDLLQAYDDYYGAVSDAVTIENAADALLREHVRRRELVEGQAYTTRGGDGLGEYKGSHIEIRGGQIWAIDEFEHGKNEAQLTVDPNGEEFTEDYRNRQVNLDWQALTGADCTASPLQALTNRQTTARDLNTLMRDQTIEQRDNLTTQLGNLDTQFRDALAQSEGGSVLPPPGTLPEGVQPVTIEIAPGKTVQVAPGVAERFRALGFDALIGPNTYVLANVEITQPDGTTRREERWVTGETARLQVLRDQARSQVAALDPVIEQFDNMREFQNLRLSEPSMLLAPWNDAQQAFVEDNPGQLLDAVYQPQFDGLADKPENNEFVALSGSSLDDRVRTALGEGNTEQLESIIDEIHDIGGDDPMVRNVPIVYIDPDGFAQPQTLFAVQGDGGTRYVDLNGKSYDSVQDFRDNTDLYIGGNLVVPKNFEMARGPDGQVPLEMLDARDLSFVEKTLDPVVGIVTGLATIASFTPLAPIAAPIAFGGAAYLGARTVYRQAQHVQHGGDWNDRESVMNMAMIGTTVVPFFSSGLRTAGLFRTAAEIRYGTAGVQGLAQRGMVTTDAFRASIGGLAPQSVLAQRSVQFMSSTSLMNRTARGLDWTAMGVGAPLMAASASDLFLHGDQMNGLQMLDAVLGLSVGAFGTGMGARGLMMTRPGRTSAAGPEAVPPAASGAKEIIIPGQPRPGDPADLVIPGRTEPGDPSSLIVVQQRAPREVFDAVTGTWRPVALGQGDGPPAQDGSPRTPRSLSAAYRDPNSPVPPSDGGIPAAFRRPSTPDLPPLRPDGTISPASFLPPGFETAGLATGSFQRGGSPIHMATTLYKGRGVDLFVARGGVEAAARVLRSKQNVMLVTGFNVAKGLPETDGPPGTALLGRTLRLLGKEVTYVTDQSNAPILRASLEAIGQPTDRVIEFSALHGTDDARVQADRFLDDIGPDAVMSIELPGRNAEGEYLNMRGISVRSDGEGTEGMVNPPLDEIILAANDRADIDTLGIGDGGNESGMGAVRRLIPPARNGDNMASVVPVDYLVTSSVSNWGAEGVAASLARMSDRPDLFHTEEQQFAAIDAAARAGAVDGVSRLQEASVDGFSWQAHRGFHRLLSQAVDMTHIEPIHLGVMDSSSGGLYAANTLARYIREETGRLVQRVIATDNINAPYGVLSQEDIARNTNSVLRVLDKSLSGTASYRVIAMACNTACTPGTSVIAQGVDTPVINLVEVTARAMVDPAIAGERPVSLSTSATRDSHAYANAVRDLTDGRVSVTEVGASDKSNPNEFDLATLVNNGMHTSKDPEVQATVQRAVDRYVQKVPEDATSVWLTCTHYPALRDQIVQSLANRGLAHVNVVDPMRFQADAIIDHLNLPRIEHGTGPRLDRARPPVVITSGERARVFSVDGNGETEINNFVTSLNIAKSARAFMRRDDVRVVMVDGFNNVGERELTPIRHQIFRPNLPHDGTLHELSVPIMRNGEVVGWLPKSTFESSAVYNQYSDPAQARYLTRQVEQMLENIAAPRRQPQSLSAAYHDPSQPPPQGPEAGGGIPAAFRRPPEAVAPAARGAREIIIPGQSRPGDPADLVIPGRTEPGDPSSLIVARQRAPREVFDAVTGTWHPVARGQGDGPPAQDGSPRAPRSLSAAYRDPNSPLRSFAGRAARYAPFVGVNAALATTVPPHYLVIGNAAAFVARGLGTLPGAISPKTFTADSTLGRVVRGFNMATFIPNAAYHSWTLGSGAGLPYNQLYAVTDHLGQVQNASEAATGKPFKPSLVEKYGGIAAANAANTFLLLGYSIPAGPGATVTNLLFGGGVAYQHYRAVQADIAAARGTTPKSGTLGPRLAMAASGVGLIGFGAHLLLENAAAGDTELPSGPTPDLEQPTLAPTEPTQPDRPEPGEPDRPEPDEPDRPEPDEPDRPEPGEPDRPEPDEPDEPEPDEPDEQPRQLVASPEIGLNLREDASASSPKVTIFEPGALIEQTGDPVRDDSGREWIPVEGYGADGREHRGWVAADYADAHAEGDQDARGRFNPELEERGNRSVTARDGDSISLIARRNSADVGDTVMLNMDHILVPHLIFAGDRIYLPAQSA